MSDSADKERNAVLSTDRLRRNVGAGMDPAFLQTPFYGADNKKIKHRVHRGALCLPADVLATYEPPEKEYELPAVGSVVRPSVDDSRKVVVAQVRYEERLEDVMVDGLPQKRPVSRILITNEFLKRPEAKRIRGGGDEPTGGPPGSSSATPMEIDSVPTSTAPNAPQSSTNTAASAGAPAIAANTNASTGATVSQAQPIQQSASAQPQRAEIPAKPHSAGTAAKPATSAAPAPGPAIAETATSSTTTQSSGDNGGTVADKQPSQVSSSNTDSKTESKPEGPKPKDAKVVPLTETPKSQWEQRKPTRDELPLESLGSSTKPDWYQPDVASELEKAILPEWFDQTAKHRTAETYVEVREKIILMYSQLGANRFLTGTMVRRTIPGDAASLLRLHDFLSSHGLINQHAVNDTQPALKLLHKSATATTRDNLIKAVIQQVRSTKRPEASSSATSMDNLEVNWGTVAATVGEGMTAAACERTFLEMTTSAAVGGDRTAESDSSIADLLAKCKPTVVQAAVAGALTKSDNWEEARNAGAAASIVAQSNEQAKAHETRLAHILSRTLDTRMERLESRLAMIEEVEGMLDAERISLNIERRDLYTARCRNWFNAT